MLFAGTLLKNGSFEEGLAEWSARWGSPVASQESSVHGSRSLLLEGERACVLQSIELEEGVTYEVSGYVKGEGIPSEDGNGARLVLEGNNRWLRVTSHLDETPDTGTFDWRFMRGLFTAEQTNGTTVGIAPTLVGGGKAWFDNIKVRAVAKENTDAAPQKSFRKNYGSFVADGWLYPGQGTQDDSLGVRGFFAPGDAVDMHLDLQGTGACNVSLVLHDARGGELWRQELQGVTLPLRKTFVLEGKFPKGYYVMDGEITGEDGRRAFFCQGAFVVQDNPLEPRDTFYSFGYGVDARFADGYKRIGTGNISLKLFWDSYYMRTPQFLCDFNLNQYRRFLENDDFELDFHVCTACRKELRRDDEAVAAGLSYVNDRLQQTISELVTLVAEATKGRVATWSAGQEIPSSATIKFKFCGSWAESMAQQVILCRIISRAVRKVDPSIPFWIGANNQISAIEPYERIVLEDLKDEFDGYLIDGYTGNWDLSLGNVPPPEVNTLEFIERSSKLAESVGKTPTVRNNEVGYAVLYGSPLDTGLTIQQAEYTARSLILNRVAGVLSYSIFRPNEYAEADVSDEKARSMNTIWRTVSPTTGELVGVPLPGAAMFATLARELAFVKCTGKSVYGKFYLYLFERKDGRSVATLWNREKAEDVTMGISSDAKLVTMLGEESTLSPGAVVSVSTAPVYIVSDTPSGQLLQELRASILDSVPGFRVSGLRENRDQLAVFVNNYGDDVIEGEIVMDGQEPLPISVLPHTEKKTLVPYAPRGEFLCGGKPTAFVDEAPPPVQVTRLSSRPALDGTGAWLEGIPSFSLGYPKDVYPRSALQPEKAYFKTDYSPDKHNFAAECHLAYDGEFIYLAARVDDPFHCQRFKGTDLWRGDALQFSLATEAVPPESVRLDEGDEGRRGLFNYAAALGNDGEVLLERQDGAPAPAEIHANVTRNGDFTFYEIAIPWKALGTTPQEATALRMGFVIFDCLSDTAAEPPYWLSFGQGVAGGEDAAKFVPLFLAQ